MPQKRLLEMYHDLKESGSSSDFPYLLANTMYKKLLARFNGFPSPWQKYVLKSDLSDFKANDRVILSTAPDLDEIDVDGHYNDATFTDARYQIQAKTYGKTFTIDRHTIINDDLNGIMQFPNKFGAATVRTMVKKLLTLLNGSSLAYDAKTLFNLRSATTRNYIVNTTLANTAAGMAAIQSAAARMRGMVDPDNGEPMGIVPKYILTGTTLAPIARQLVKSATMLPVSTNGGGTYNEIAYLEVIEEPLIDTQLSTTFSAVLADPADCPVIEVGFLNGKETPDLLVSKAEMVSVAGGGEDPYGYEFDTLKYKVRHDWAAQLAYYQGIVRISS